MISLAVILLIVGLVLLFLGIFVGAAKFLLWVGIVILIVAVVVGLVRLLRRSV
ncbi:hypothetical protein [Humibacter ginsenosidimutans]|uniref:hypothetical protein n=1 Tax=Humibacter ginsenosidimutans TaxID=2599293 RepID=UPI00143D99D2|nr:hypothetical protein [Humibacter ginsenosidimutans]